jgi:opacity protein-like surface antigen
MQESMAMPDTATAAGAARVETAASEAPETVAPGTAARTDATADALPSRAAQPDLGVRYTTAAARAVPPPATRNAQRQAPASQPDFLFGRPRVSLGLRGLLHRARADSDFYDFANDQLFVRRSPEDNPKNPAHGLLNFDAPGISFDFGFGVTSQLDVRVGVDYAASSNQSETRGFQGSDGLPIEQRTTLSQVDLRGEIALALAPRGRAIGQYAWIPSRAVPYVGIGLGFVRYDLTQIGEFVDDLGIFPDSFTSNGWGPGVHLFGGADIRMTRHVFLNAEARYVQASAGLDEDFAGFEPLDLGGLRIGAGVRFAF